MNSLPEDWSAEKLGDIVQDARTSITPVAGTKYELWSVPSFATGSPEIVDGSTVKSSKLVVQPDDVLISKINPRINRVWKVQNSQLPQIGSTEWLVARIRDKKKVNPNYLTLYLSSPPFREWITQASEGVTGSHSRAKSPQILKQLVPIPPLNAQERIVEFLEGHLSHLDKALEEVEIGLSKTASFRSSLLHSAYIGGLLPNYLLGDAVQIGNLGKWQGGGTPSKANSSFWSGGTIPWLTAKDMVSFKTSATQDLITPSAVSGSSASLIPAGAVVVVARSGILERKLPVTVTELEVTVNQDMKALICKDGVDPRWVAYGLLAFEQQILRTCRKAGTTVANLNFQEFLRFELPLPALEIQHQVLDEIESRLIELDKTISGLKATQRRAQDLRRSILQSAFSGQLLNKDSYE